jgi:hypothetical protein
MEPKYTEEGHSSDATRSHSSGLIILEKLFEDLNPVSSLLDVGGGLGTWCSAAKVLGVPRVELIDGPWVNIEDLFVGRHEFTQHNLELPLPQEINGTSRFDVAICMEVAEHLSPERAEGLVHDLCSKSDVILFSAGIPEQGGLNHINERWQSYWVDLFRAEGYSCLDSIRQHVWHHPEVNVWYKQNTLVFKRGQLNDEYAILDIVHPDNWIHINGLFEKSMKILEGRRLRKVIKWVLPNRIINLLRRN